MQQESRSRKTGTTRESSRQLGQAGEDYAAGHLERAGYQVLARNVRAGGVEMDIIARKGRLLVFVEVKARRSTRYGPPELAVDRAKQRRLVAGARAWLRETRTRAGRVRFDVISLCIRSADHTELTHFEAAFDAEY